MADSTDQAGNDGPTASTGALPRRRRARNVAIGSGVALAALLGGTWLARDRIATGLIDRQLGALGLPATYRIVSIAPGRQVLEHIVVGDPRHPDLTIERAELAVVYGMGAPRLGQIKLVGARLFGTVHDGKASFGALDKLLFAPSPDTTPVRLPDYDVALIDTRALLDTDQGRIGVKAEGSGRLRDGFAGTLAAVSPGLMLGSCRTERATLFGKVTVQGERPRFAGPLRTGAVRCGGASARDLTLDLDARGDKDLAGVTLRSALRTGPLGTQSADAQSLAFDAALTLRDGSATGHLAATAGGVRTSGASLGVLSLDGMMRARSAGAALDFRGTAEGEGLRRGPALDRALAAAQAQAADTLLAPLAAKMRAALAREEPGSRLRGEFALRHEDGGWSLVVPSASLRGGSGQRLLALSRVHVDSPAGARLPRISGAFATGGPGLPQIEGQMGGAGLGKHDLRLSMADYAAGGARLAIPAMVVTQATDGSVGFSGAARLSGAIPGGAVSNLALPVQGAYGGNGTLALWRRCITPRFDALSVGDLRLDGQALTLCPAQGGAIVRSDRAGTHIAAGAPKLALSGRFGGTPMVVRTGAIGFAAPGTVSVRNADLVLGAPDSATHLALGSLVARVGKDWRGQFDGASARLASVPLDIGGASGSWRYAGGRLDIAGATFGVTDRQDPARFEPLTSRDATLSLAGGRIAASALLREPKEGREIAQVDLRHDLGTGIGHADLTVERLAFENRKDNSGLQPTDLTRLALGVVANVDGTVTGKGRIDWTGERVTSTGRFGSAGLDLAAALGPVKGLSGTLEFTDLLGMVTAPHQKLAIASVNPGIEVTDGVADIELRPDQVLRLNGAEWPFLGGRIALEPTELHLALAEERRYTLDITGLDAAQFVERMQLGNIAATGTFDGQLPLVFDARGGRIVGGSLLSRPPGGNVSYVGALTYKDLTAMANFAFAALKSVDYRTMVIGMNGDLAGEVVTSVQFDGVRQGAGTKQNFITREIGKLPLQFRVTIKAPFYQLIGSLRSMYDPAMVRDPRTLGLVDAQGRVITQPASLTAPANPVQSAESADLP